ncbi:hypothetical protein KC332_g15026 [Hortaea werneckii]|uniref:Biogenesis of lysosome-related organelles complex 1 subunit CNL1 n=2 Tax=Hortaea werneckii TaxID=91943 RepID=A0A3M7HYW3_HORWE|nr:hypothetical protein KC350_g18964 [Hortaea werneckii]OTA24075.1 hypothetical protein BTJ68_12906 [Hortaea werneckii EXF-2000]KAI6787065.1 hypothetical protein KC358_g18899 [Hortaea werneckii]KAI6893096.1 hypothetical protein KC348_g18810 [Hortaea werneckii]KAI6916802.1 hypothetical protein KC341_g18882 [Hortaea werneckii]
MPHHTAHSSSHPRSPPQATTAAATNPASIPDTRLGLSPQDVATLRQHQQLALAHTPQARRSPAATASSSHASSSQGRLLLDPGSLHMLAQHFDRVMQAIAQRLDQLNRATETATQTQYDRAGHAIQMADAEIARFRAILRQIDELETEFEKIARIREIVRGFRARVEHLDRRLG